MLLPHTVEVGDLDSEILEGQVGLGLPQLAGGQLLLQTGYVVLRDTFPHGPSFLLSLLDFLSQALDGLLILCLSQSHLDKLILGTVDHLLILIDNFCFKRDLLQK